MTLRPCEQDALERGVQSLQGPGPTPNPYCQVSGEIQWSSHSVPKEVPGRDRPASGRRTEASYM